MRISSRLQIALFSAGISGAMLLLFASFLWFRVYELRLAAVDREIRSIASRHPGLWAGRANYERLAASLELAFGAGHTNQVIVHLRDKTSAVFYTSPHWPQFLALETLGLQPASPSPAHATGRNPGDSPAADGSPAAEHGFGPGMGRGGPPPPVVFATAPRFLTVHSGDSAWRIGLLANDSITLVLGLNHDAVEGELRNVRNSFLFTLPFALAAVGWAGWLVAGKALQPLRIIAVTAERVTARGLDQRIPDAHRSPEAQRLIQVFNGMLDRLETSFRQATRFSADASHELKTPLTVMQGELENALNSASPGSPEQQLFSTLLEETQRLKTITRSLLLLAQADAGQLKLALERVDLTTELEAMVEDARILSADANLSFHLEAKPGEIVSADRALLYTAVFNLLTNAVKFNQPQGSVHLTLQREEGKVTLTVCNTGPGIPLEEQSRVFNRFHRVQHPDRPKTEGVGLGLSLAREIMRAHGGDLSLRESNTEQTCFELSLLRHKE
jgi:two-component system heavy metal sensor histidine kinase CusS